MNTHPRDYVAAAVATVQCPRCSQLQDLRQVERAVGVVEFAGVCATPMRGAGFCSTTLRLSAAAHVLPAASA
jgi:hypothetical protein